MNHQQDDRVSVYPSLPNGPPTLFALGTDSI
jgi:hypothetical protein